MKPRFLTFLKIQAQARPPFPSEVSLQHHVGPWSSENPSMNLQLPWTSSPPPLLDLPAPARYLPVPSHCARSALMHRREYLHRVMLKTKPLLTPVCQLGFPESPGEAKLGVRPLAFPKPSPWRASGAASPVGHSPHQAGEASLGDQGTLCPVAAWTTGCGRLVLAQS